MSIKVIMDVFKNKHIPSDKKIKIIEELGRAVNYEFATLIKLKAYWARSRVMGDYDKSIHSNPDAIAWAKFFVKVVGERKPDLDEAYMVGWFANAMMAMSDYKDQSKPKRTISLDTYLIMQSEMMTHNELSIKDCKEIVDAILKLNGVEVFDV